MEGRELLYREAVAEAMYQEMERDPSVFLMGEDVGCHGGAFKASVGLLEAFGPGRVRDTPISESIIVGSAVGAAMTGQRPIAEIMYVDFSTMAMDSIVNQAAKVKYMYGGGATVPLTIRSAFGAGTGQAAQHSQSFESIFNAVPGLWIVMPSTPYDAKGLLKSAIRSNNVVVVLEHKLLYKERGPVPKDDYVVDLGKAVVRREGEDVTIVATSRMNRLAMAAAETLSGEGIDAEVIDPRTIKPLDMETIAASVQKTNRVVVVNEGHRTGGLTSELAARIMDACFYDLDAPVARVASEDVPIPFNRGLEQAVIPSEHDIVKAAGKVMEQ